MSPASPLIAQGDAITAAGPWSQAFPGRFVLNAGIPGNTTVDLLGRLDVLPGLDGATLPCEAARWGPRCLAPVRDLNRRLRGAVPAADFLDLTDLLADGPACAVPWGWMACISAPMVTTSGLRGCGPWCKLLSWLRPEGHAP